MAPGGMGGMSTPTSTPEAFDGEVRSGGSSRGGGGGDNGPYR